MARKSTNTFWKTIVVDCILHSKASDYRINLAKIIKEEELSKQDEMRFRQAYNKVIELLDLFVKIEFKSEEESNSFNNSMLLAEDKDENETWGHYLQRKRYSESN